MSAKISLAKLAAFGCVLTICSGMMSPIAAGQASGSSAVQRFEVSTVKPTGADTGSASGIETGNGRLDARNVTLKRCIMGAYGIGPHQLVGGPDWVTSQRFDILAKAEQPTDSDDLLMVMLQGLLTERFKLASHREKRTMSAYVLEVAKSGPKLEASKGGDADNTTSSSNTGITIDARNDDMNTFARILSRTMDLPVVNQTGLVGAFNLKLHWMPENLTTDGTTEAVSIFTAIQEQLGLRLREQKVPVEVIVIDHVEQPSEN